MILEKVICVVNWIAFLQAASSKIKVSKYGFRCLQTAVCPCGTVLSLILSSFMEAMRLWDPETLTKICRNPIHQRNINPPERVWHDWSNLACIGDMLKTASPDLWDFKNWRTYQCFLVIWKQGIKRSSFSWVSIFCMESPGGTMAGFWPVDVLLSLFLHDEFFQSVSLLILRPEMNISS